MLQEMKAEHWLDADGNPAGGVTCAMGMCISWQHGPLGRRPTWTANGCFVETVISAAINRLQFYQASQFACEENDAAIANLEAALDALRKRTEDRERRGVEGSNAC